MNEDSIESISGIQFLWPSGSNAAGQTLTSCRSKMALNTLALYAELNTKNKADVRALLTLHDSARIGEGVHPSVDYILNAIDTHCDTDNLPFCSRLEIENWSPETLKAVLHEKVSHCEFLRQAIAKTKVNIACLYMHARFSCMFNRLTSCRSRRSPHRLPLQIVLHIMKMMKATGASMACVGE